jgi:dihydrofolate reductase
MEAAMRNIIESTLVSIDGVIGEPHLWAREYFGDEAREDALKQLLASDAMLMGKRTYEIFAKLWPAQNGPYAERINRMRKYVFSSTLASADWSNTTIVRGDVAAEVRKLKEQEGQDLVMYGHGPLGQALLEHRLLDELRFAIHPVFVGRGTPLLRDGETTPLQLVRTKTFGNGVVVLSYRPLS